MNKQAEPLEVVGPFNEYRLVVDGYQVPFISGFIKDRVLHLTLDRRFGCDVEIPEQYEPERYAKSIVWFIANAMAVAAGYSCFGEHSQPLNRYKRRCSRLDLETVDVEVLSGQPQ